MPNAVCRLFGIRYPVVMGAIASEPELGAAISAAGGLGCIAGGGGTLAVLQERIGRFRALTDRPFAVNFPISLIPQKDVESKMQLMVDLRVPVVITSAGNPKLWTKFLQAGGCMVAHVLPSLYHARKAMDAGVEAIIAEPAESGGYRGEDEVSMMVLIPAIRSAFPDIPLIAAGAVADRRGMAAVMALGADGVQLGTRFLATAEAPSGEHVRKMILAATDTSTMSAEGRVKPRVGRPELAEAVLGERRRVQMGQVSALIDDIVTVEDVIRELCEGGRERAHAVSRGMDELFAT